MRTLRTSLPRSAECVGPFLSRPGNQHPHGPAGDITLAESPSIRCRQCSVHCLTEAIVENDETAIVRAALRRLGFKAVFDTSFAADLTIIEEASEFVARFVEGKGELPLITSCCPAWVDYLEKNFSDLIPLFSTAKSPNKCSGPWRRPITRKKPACLPIRSISFQSCPAPPRNTNWNARGNAVLRPP